MSKKELGFEFKQVEIGDNTYNIRQFKALEGLDFMGKMQREGMTSELIFEAINKCAAIGSVSFTKTKFNEHFGNRYAEIFKLVEEIISFNFPDLDTEGNEESDIEE